MASTYRAALLPLYCLQRIRRFHGTDPIRNGVLNNAQNSCSTSSRHGSAEARVSRRSSPLLLREAKPAILWLGELRVVELYPAFTPDRRRDKPLVHHEPRGR